MEFVDKVHFKNYIRKIALASGIEYFDFEQKYSHNLFDFYIFIENNSRVLNQIGLTKLLDKVLIRFKRVTRGDQNSEYRFFVVYEEFQEIFSELKHFFAVKNLFSFDSLERGKKLPHYCNESDKKSYRLLFSIFYEIGEYNSLYRECLSPSKCFITFLEKHRNTSGIYFLYNLNKELLYIGKSTDLGARIKGSINERKSVNGYVQVVIPEKKGDRHIYESYYILKEKPLLNEEGNLHEETSLKLPDLPKSVMVKIFENV